MSLSAQSRRSSLVLLIVVLISIGPAHSRGGTRIADGEPSRPAGDKSRYHLFDPTPRELMREMSTDRPDTTESPYTVDAGHYQIEMSFFDFNRDRANGARIETWTFGALNLKAGLLPNVDLQAVFDSYANEETRSGGITETASGFSDVTLRLKVNLWGNDGGRTAFAIMPFVKIPTGTELSNDHWEGGLILPLAISLTDRVGLGLMIEADFVHDDEQGGYDVEWVHTVTLGFDLTGKLGLYVEYAGVAGPDQAFEYQATFDAGITWSATDDLVFDAGVRVGLNDAAQDLGVFTGMSVRF